MRWLAEASRAATSATLAAGKACSMRAATPVAWGVAILVPDIMALAVSLRGRMGRKKAGRCRRRP